MWLLFLTNLLKVNLKGDYRDSTGIGCYYYLIVYQLEILIYYRFLYREPSNLGDHRNFLVNLKKLVYLKYDQILESNHMSINFEENSKSGACAPLLIRSFLVKALPILFYFYWIRECLDLGITFSLFPPIQLFHYNEQKFIVLQDQWIPK